MPETVRISSESETLLADLYGDLPSRRATILVHGQAWDASGWRDVAQLFVGGGIPALALNLRGYAGSSGKTSEFAPPAEWSPVADLRAAKALLRDRGAREIALVGASQLFVCADGDSAAPHVLRCFDVAPKPKTLLMFGGKEHSRGMFAAPYGPEATLAIVDFMARGV